MPSDKAAAKTAKAAKRSRTAEASSSAQAQPSSKRTKKGDKAAPSSSSTKTVASSSSLFGKPAASFDSELDAMFAAAPKPKLAAPAPAPVASAASKPKGKAPAPPQAEATSEDDDDEAVAEELDSDEALRAAIKESGLDWSDGDDAELVEASDEEEDGMEAEHGFEDERPPVGDDEEEEDEEEEGSGDDEEDEEDDTDNDGEMEPSTLVHESKVDPAVQAARLSERAAKKAARLAEPREARDARSIFVGNIPIEAVMSKSITKQLRRHLRSFALWPSVTRIESIRYRSVPFSVPTGDYTAPDAETADHAAKRRERSRAYRNAQQEAEGVAPGPAKVFLNPAQKRKVAYINEEVNSKATSVNAYVTLAAPSERALEKLPSETHRDAKRLTGPVLAALLAAAADGSVFAGRHLRADTVVPLSSEQLTEAGLNGITFPSSSSKASPAESSRTLFVGNLDFEADEELLRVFFEGLVREERGAPPPRPDADWAKLIKLPPPEVGIAQPVSDEDEEDPERAPTAIARPPPEWVQSVRLVRDPATQLGKGFGYVRFVDEACVDELIALYEAETAFLDATKSRSGASRNAAASQAAALGENGFKRRLKFAKRPLRLSRCSNKPSANKRAATGKPKGKENGTPNRSGRQDSTPRSARARSSGAPTPGGTSPFHRGRPQPQGSSPQQTPTKQRAAKPSSAPTSTSTPAPNPGPQKPRDAAKEARLAAKRADPERQAKRADKKARKSAAAKVLADEARGMGAKGKTSLVTRRRSKGGSKGKAASGGKWKKAAMAGMMATAASTMRGVRANTDVAVFGPVLCRADEVGHLALRAAQDVAKDWPLMRPSPLPNLFSITPSAGESAKHGWTSSTGAWIVLDVSGRDSPYLHASSRSSVDGETLKPANLATPEFPLLSATHSTQLSPRDRLLRALPRRLKWLFTRRFTLRLSWPANHPAGFAISIHTPQSMLRQGGIAWSAEPINEAGETINYNASTTTTTARVSHAEGPGQATSAPTDRGTQAQLQDEDPLGIERWACPLLFAHVRAWPEAVPIPPAPPSSHIGLLNRLAETYVGPLWAASSDDATPRAVPMHLTLEPVHGLAVPENALPLLGLLLPTLLFVWFLARSGIARAIHASQHRP